jgi:hypothetical protein
VTWLGDSENAVIVGTRELGIDADGFVVGIFFFSGDRNGPKEKIGDVSEYGGATSCDEVCGEELVEFRERVVDADGGGEFVAVSGEALKKVGGGLLLLLEGVAVAEAGVVVRDG